MKRRNFLSAIPALAALPFVKAEAELQDYPTGKWSAAAVSLKAMRTQEEAERKWILKHIALPQTNRFRAEIGLPPWTFEQLITAHRTCPLTKAREKAQT